MLLPGARPRAAETLRYVVAVTPSGEDAVDAAVAESATLVTLHDSSGELSPIGLVARARADDARLTAALRSLGHYDGHSVITLAERPLDDPGLPDYLAGLAENAEVSVAVTVTPGPITRLRAIHVNGDTAGMTLGLTPGEPAQAARVLAAGETLQAALQAAGHAFARVDPPIADLDAAHNALDVTFEVSAGPRVDIGEIAVSGLTSLDETYIRRRLTLKPGTPFSPEALDAVRTDLSKVPIIASARVVPGTALDAAGRLPVTVELSERKLRVVTATAGFSTDQGGTASVTWTHRNLFGSAEVLSLTAAITDIGASAATSAGYNIGATYTIPDWRARDQSLTLTALAVKESLNAYDRTATLGGVAYGFRLDDHLTATLGLAAERSFITQNMVGQNYALFQTPLALRYDTSNSTVEPTSGLRAEAQVTPTLSLSNHNATFAITQISGSGYFDLGEPGRTVLALRGIIGSVTGATTMEIPPDQRFYAGGSGTVRGYRYQSLGPQFSANKPLGGTALAAGTIELRQRFGESWGMAVFADGGQLSPGSRPFQGKFQVGVGTGVRYYTSIGAIRLDVAAPVARPKGGDIGEIYVGLGQAF